MGCDAALGSGVAEFLLFNRSSLLHDMPMGSSWGAGAGIGSNTLIAKTWILERLAFTQRIFLLKFKFLTGMLQKNETLKF